MASGIDPNGNPLTQLSDIPLNSTDQLSTLVIDGGGISRFIGKNFHLESLYVLFYLTFFRTKIFDARCLL